MANVRALILSHSVVFAAGFVLGKRIDADELGTYRALHESDFTRIRRKAEAVALGMVVVGGIVWIVRATTRKSPA